MSVSRESLKALRQSIAVIGRDGARHMGGAEAGRVPLGHPEVDHALGGGLMRAASHDVMPATPRDAAAATGFALGLVSRLAEASAWVWIRQDMAGRESGEPYGPGLAAFGLDPSRLVLVSTPDAREALRAAEESLRCAALGAVLFEPWGDPKPLDLTATRRLSLAAEQSGVTLLTLRSGGHGPLGSSRTRWDIAAAPSFGEMGGGPGLPAFAAHLVLNRQTGAGGPGGIWNMEWTHGDNIFRPAHSRPLLSPSGDRPIATAAAPVLHFQRTG